MRPTVAKNDNNTYQQPANKLNLNIKRTEYTLCLKKRPTFDLL